MEWVFMSVVRVTKEIPPKPGRHIDLDDVDSFGIAEGAKAGSIVSGIRSQLDPRVSRQTAATATRRGLINAPAFTFTAGTGCHGGPICHDARGRRCVAWATAWAAKAHDGAVHSSATGRSARGCGRERCFNGAPKGASKLIGCGRNKVYKLIASGELESFTQGRKRLITTASIRAHIALQMQQPVCRRRQIPP
jgi:excisionase family DNA binding protein